MIRLAAALFAIVPAVLAGGEARAAAAGEAWCAAITRRVDAVPGQGAVFLLSYEQAPEPALATAAFTYDNALAAIALVACDKFEQARRIGDALVLAAASDRAGDTGRLRNAYRAGRQDKPPPPPNGWWDAQAKRWLEDDYQVGTAAGNVAWAGLALMTVAEASPDGARYRAGAAKLAGWVEAHLSDPRGGFRGGIHGGEGRETPLTWKSTEHNVDLTALFAWLGRGEAAAVAEAFVHAHWDEPSGRFWTGTLPDGAGINRSTSGLDAQLWPQLLPQAPERWQRAMQYAERAHGIDGGFDFNDDRDGVWVEGTAQAALVYRALGDAPRSKELLETVAREGSPGGLLFATRPQRLTTGLAIGPDSITDDFLYYRRPHLGATAWAVLAATGWNPFTGRRIR